jgi:hypothetical protein
VRAAPPLVMNLEYVALAILIVVVLIIFYGIIAIHDIPYDIARRRDHPQQDAIHVAGWISLFTLHTIWPFLWIWATLYRKDRGWGFTNIAGNPESLVETVKELQKQLEEVQSELIVLKAQQTAETSPPASKSE